MTAFTIALLTNECINNPANLSDVSVVLGGLGTGLTLTQAFNQAQDGVVTSILNLPKADLTNWTDGVSASIKRNDIKTSEVLGAIDIRDFVTQITAAAPTTLHGGYLAALLSDDLIQLVNDDGTDSTVLKNLKLYVVAVGQGSQGRLVALSTRPGSRAESLWGRNTFISMEQAAQAGGRG